MLTAENDPIGAACLDYLSGNKSGKILVKSSLAEDDSIPVKYLFRKFYEMPELEQKALLICKGRVLDAGAGAGSHALYLQNKGVEVTAIDISPNACMAMQQRGIQQVENVDFFMFEPEEKFDTILLLMNGIGFVGKVDRFPLFFQKAKALLKPGGQIVLDSTDVKYLFDEEDTHHLLEEMNHYYGEIEYRMSYKKSMGDAFNWLFIDERLLHQLAMNNGFHFERLASGNHHDYLARLTLTME
jgi:SAM-dependent methyltransferase